MDKDANVLEQSYFRLIKALDRALDTRNHEAAVGYSQALAFITEAMGNLKYLETMRGGDEWRE